MYRNEYLISDAAIATLAKEYVTGIASIEKVRGNYLRALVAHSQAACFGTKRLTTEKTLDLVQKVHERLYGIVLSAITTADIAPDAEAPAEEQHRRALERNRRSNFARSAKSTLDAWIQFGGKLKDLRPEDVTKEGLRRGSGESDRSSPDRLVRSTDRTLRRLEKLVTELVAVDRDAASRVYEELIEKLGPLVAKPLTRRAMKRGEVTLHPTH